MWKQHVSYNIYFFRHTVESFIGDCYILYGSKCVEGGACCIQFFSSGRDCLSLTKTVRLLMQERQKSWAHTPTKITEREIPASGIMFTYSTAYTTCTGTIHLHARAHTQTHT